MKTQNLKCSNPECAEPNWERPQARGRIPLLCPVCREAGMVPPPPEEREAEADQGDAPFLSADTYVISCLGLEVAQKVIDGLKLNYAKTEFYTKPDKDDEIDIMVRRRVPYSVSHDVLTRLKLRAEDVLDGLTSAIPHHEETVEVAA